MNNNLNNLERTVMGIIKSELDDNPHYFKNVLEHGCVSGSVDELIYYSDTTEWFDTHKNDIFNLLKEQEINLTDLTNVEIEDITEQNDKYKNVMSWFSFEETLYRLAESHKLYFKSLGAVL